jgi:hypothetical protein
MRSSQAMSQTKVLFTIPQVSLVDTTSRLYIHVGLFVQFDKMAHCRTNS